MKKIISLLLALVLCLGVLVACDSSPADGGNSDGGNTDEDNENMNGGEALADRKTVTLGAYEQDNDTANGAEAIEWIVLAEENGKALLLSKYALDCVAYDNDDKLDAVWATSYACTWLNVVFYNTAFTDAEREKICATQVVTMGDPVFKTDVEVDTVNNVFLLSIEETEKYLPTDEERECRVTAYAKANGAQMGVFDPYLNNGYWWLRSPSWSTLGAASVDSDGFINEQGYVEEFAQNVVRPAMWVDASALSAAK